MGVSSSLEKCRNSRANLASLYLHRNTKVKGRREDVIPIDQLKSRANEPLGIAHTCPLTEPNLPLKAGMRSLVYLGSTLTAKLYIYLHCSVVCKSKTRQNKADKTNWKQS